MYMPFLLLFHSLSFCVFAFLTLWWCVFVFVCMCFYIYIQHTYVFICLCTYIFICTCVSFMKNRREDSFKAIHERVGEITHELESLFIPKIPDLRETEQDLAEINKRWEHSKSFHRPVECLVEKVPSPGPMVEPQAYSPARSSSSSTPIATATASTASPLSGPEGSEGDPVAETLEANSVPPQFRCALSGELMKDPVHDPFGFVYERQEVERYLLDDAHRNMCPMNGQVSGTNIRVSHLTPF